MIPILTSMLMVGAIAGIFALPSLTAKIKTSFHQNSVVNFQIKFQAAQLILAAIVLAFVYLLNPENFRMFFNTGNIYAHITEVTWLGIIGTETWLEIATSLGLFITLGTGIFMFFQLKKAGGGYRYFLFSLLWAIPFSITNAFSEEAIFRLGIISPLYGIFSVPTLLLISAVLFGLPHYFGTPSGIIGVLMAGFLGWLLAMSVVETQGIFLAWAIHFVQDVVIITSLLLMSMRNDPNSR
jgi:membrane protease YdiL (CAAX protease family)